MASLTPSFGGISHTRLEAGGITPSFDTLRRIAAERDNLRAAVHWAIDSSDAGNDSLLFANLKRLYDSPTFLALNPDGEVAMKSAIANWRIAVQKIRSGVDVIEAETDDQVNDLIKIEFLDSINSGLTDQDDMDINTLTQALDTISAFLNGPYTVRFSNTNCEQVCDQHGCSETNCDTTWVSIKINLSAIFETPVADLKSKLPYLQWKPASQWRVADADTEWVGQFQGDWKKQCFYDSLSGWSDSCVMVFAPDSGEFELRDRWEPIELTTASGTVLSDSLLDADGPEFPDYTFNGLFPELTTKADWEELFESNTDTNAPTAGSPKVLGLTLARDLR